MNKAKFSQNNYSTSLVFFQRFYDWYWEGEGFKFLIIIGVVIPLLILIRIYLPGDADIGLVKLSRAQAFLFFRFDKYLAALYPVFVSLIGISAAFVGSLSIQYSIIKIAFRYWYIHLLVFEVLVIVIGLLFPPISLSFSFLIVANLVFILHTIMLIDKFYEPEEMMVDVIVPQIMYFIKTAGDTTGLFYDLSKTKCDIGVKPYSDININSNPELAAFSKAICRLVKSHSLRPGHLLQYLMNSLSVGCALDKKYQLNIINFRNLLISYSMTELSKFSAQPEFSREYETFFYSVLVSYVSFDEGIPPLPGGSELSKDERRPRLLINSFLYLNDFGMIAVLLMQFVISFGNELKGRKSVFSFDLLYIVNGFLLAYDEKYKIKKDKSIVLLQELKFVLSLILGVCENEKILNHYHDCEDKVKNLLAFFIVISKKILKVCDSYKDMDLGYYGEIEEVVDKIQKLILTNKILQNY